MKKVLVIEDDPDIARLIDINLHDRGYEVELVSDGSVGLNRAREDRYDLIILDIMLPGMDGFEVCRRIRGADPSTPILVLSARSEEFDKVLGLELGADAYMTKPFSVRELLARMKALFRRIEVDRETAPTERAVLEYDVIHVDCQSRIVTVDGKRIDLTAKEFDLLATFVRHPGRVFSRQELLESVWGYDYHGYSHTVNSHINRLRGKIEMDPSSPHFIRTVWGVGYRFGETS